MSYFDENSNDLNKWFRWTIMWIIGIIIICGILNFSGVLGKRILFKNSFQYQATRDAAISTYQAQLTEIEHQLSRTDLTESTRANLIAQAAALRVQIQTERYQK